MLDDDVIDFLRSLGGGMLATRSGDLQPSSCECLLVEVESDHLVVYVPEHVALKLSANLTDNRDASVVTSRLYGDHRSVQVKGRVTEFEDSRPRSVDELEPALSKVVAFFPQMDDAAAQLAAMAEQPWFRLRLQVTEVYNQTPGPKAGESMGAPA